MADFCGSPRGDGNTKPRSRGATNENRAAGGTASGANREVGLAEAIYPQLGLGFKPEIQELPTIAHRGGYTDPANGAWAPAPFGVALRILLMPYGVWTCADGRGVLFDPGARAWQRRPARRLARLTGRNGWRGSSESFIC